MPTSALEKVLLEANGLHAGYQSYAEADVLRGVHLQVPPGKITCLLGPNGAGKSTLLKALIGTIRPRLGSVFFEGRNVTRQEPEDLVRQGIHYLPQRRSLFYDLTVHENLKIAAWLLRGKGARESAIKQVYELFPDLKQMRHRRTTVLSGGQQRLLEFARALVVWPKLVMIDEPTFGLAPILARQVYEQIQWMRAQGITVLLVDQNVVEAIRIADFVYILEQGKNSREGPAHLFSQKLNELAAGWLGSGSEAGAAKF